MAGRPSNRTLRQSQVMKACVSAVARYGLEGATLEIIARAAGLSRPLIRHHLGNKMQMREMLVNHVLQELDEFAAQLGRPETVDLQSLIDYMTAPSEDADPELVLAFAALTATCGSDRALATRIRSSLEVFENAVCGLVRAEYPDADPAGCQAVAGGLVAIYFNAASLQPLSLPQPFYQRARRAMEILVGSLQAP